MLHFSYVTSFSLLLLSFVKPVILSPTTPLYGGSGCTSPFALEKLFDVSLTLGKPSIPIPVPGGVLVNEAITGGRVTGPALNATLTSGLAFPSIYENGTVQVPIINVFGMSDDGYALNIQESGIGTPEAQVTRIQISIGGDKYKKLRDGFILASIKPNTKRTMVHVQGYLVQNVA